MNRYPLTILSLVFLAHLVLLSAYGHLRTDRMTIRGIDSVGYYAWFHSVYFDRDLDFANQYEALGEGFIPYDETQTGRATNVFSAGPALALTPMLLIADGWARLGDHAADGYSRPYHGAAYLGLTFYGYVALILMAIWCGRHFGRGPGAWAALLAWGGSTLIYYTAPLVMMPHAIGSVGALLLLIACDRPHADRARGAFLCGLTLGVAMLMRWQNALFVLYPLVLSVRRWRIAEVRSDALRREILNLGLIGFGTLVSFSPQLIGWAILYGSPVLVPQGEGFLQYFRPQILHVLFSMERGLFTWTPITALGVLGLCLAKVERVRALALGLIFLAQLYLNSTVLDWDASWGFGMRRFTELVPVFAFGLGALLTRWDRAEWKRALTGLGMLLFFWNELFVFQYVAHLISWDAPLTWHEYAGDKFHLSRSLQRRLWHNEAQSELSRGEFAEALRSIEQAKQYDPHHDDIYLVEAVIHESMNNIPAAEAALARARELRPDNPHLDYLEDRIRSKSDPLP